MSRLGQPFFGLILASKVDLFYKEIQIIMRMYPSMSWWDAYGLSVQTRKWLIEEYNRQIEEENKQSKNNKNADRPLSTAPMLNQSQPKQVSSNDFMTSVRNK